VRPGRGARRASPAPRSRRPAAALHAPARPACRLRAAHRATIRTRALVAQGIRARASGARGRRFESFRGHQRCQSDNVLPANGQAPLSGRLPGRSSRPGTCGWRCDPRAIPHAGSAAVRIGRPPVRLQASEALAAHGVGADHVPVWQAVGKLQSRTHNHTSDGRSSRRDVDGHARRQSLESDR
jgi:hypothetical protein